MVVDVLLVGVLDAEDVPEDPPQDLGGGEERRVRAAREAALDAGIRAPEEAQDEVGGDRGGADARVDGAARAQAVAAGGPPLAQKKPQSMTTSQ